MGTNKKTTIKFRIDENMKRDFLKLCKIKESTMSKELKRFIESELEVERIIKANNNGLMSISWTQKIELY